MSTDVSHWTHDDVRRSDALPRLPLAAAPGDRRPARSARLPLTGQTAGRAVHDVAAGRPLLAVLRSGTTARPGQGRGDRRSRGPLLDGATPYPTEPRADPVAAEPGRGCAAPRSRRSCSRWAPSACWSRRSPSWPWRGPGWASAGRTLVLLVLTGVAPSAGPDLRRRGLRMAAEALTVVGLGLRRPRRGRRPRTRAGSATSTTRGLVPLVGAVVATVPCSADRHRAASSRLAGHRRTAGRARGRHRRAGRRRRPGPDAPGHASPCSASAGSGPPCRARRCGSRRVVPPPSAGSTRRRRARLRPRGPDARPPVGPRCDLAARWPRRARRRPPAPSSASAASPALVGYAVAALLGTYVVVLPRSTTRDGRAWPRCSASPRSGPRSPPSHRRACAAVAVAAARRSAVLPVAGRPRPGRQRAARHCSMSATPSRSRSTCTSPRPRPGCHRGSPRPRSSSWPRPGAPWSALSVPAAAYDVARRLRGSPPSSGRVVTLPLYDVPLAAVVAVLLVALVRRLRRRRTPRRPDPPPRVRDGASCPASLAVRRGPAERRDDRASCSPSPPSSAAHLMRRTDLTGDVATAALRGRLRRAGLVRGRARCRSPRSTGRSPCCSCSAASRSGGPSRCSRSPPPLVGTVASLGAVLAAADTQRALAIHLTVAGASSPPPRCVHPTRRFLAWPGGLLLAMATWVRLAELGVHTPEAYTLPSALVLTAVGLLAAAPRRPRRHAAAAGARADPGHGPVAAGRARRPDVAARAAARPRLPRAGPRRRGPALERTAGRRSRGRCALLVLRELAPYAADVPSWVVIGLSGHRAAGRRRHLGEPDARRPDRDALRRPPALTRPSAR